jgi:hypothetical protein
VKGGPWGQGLLKISVLDALKAAGATTVYREKVSGVRADRPQLAKLMAEVRCIDPIVTEGLPSCVDKAPLVIIASSGLGWAGKGSLRRYQFAQAKRSAAMAIQWPMPSPAPRRDRRRSPAGAAPSRANGELVKTPPAGLPTDYTPVEGIKEIAEAEK